MNKRALLVHTDPQTLAFLNDRLGAANLQLRMSGTVEDALNRLAHEKFDLVVSGVDFAADLKAALPAIFLLRPGGPKERIEALGPFRVLEMPIFMNDLYDMVEGRLGIKVEWQAFRKSPRLPIAIEISVVFQGRTHTVIPIKAVTLDLSLDGLKFERAMCEICTGYEKGGVHPDCILYKYAWTKPASKPVTVKIQIAKDRVMPMRAKVVSTLIEEGSSREFIGMRFVDMTTEQRERLRAVLAAHR